MRHRLRCLRVRCTSSSSVRALAGSQRRSGAHRAVDGRAHARSILRAGHRVTVLEAAAAIGEIGAGIQCDNALGLD